MKSASYYAAYIVRKLWTLAAVLLVLFAVLISVLRFTLPYMDQQKEQIETLLSNRYGIDLTIGEMSSGWNKSGPTLVLKNIVLTQDAQSPIGLEIEDTQVDIDFWGSLLARQIKSRRFDLDGLSLSVNLALIQSSDSEFPIVEALESLFLEQLRQFSVTNSVVDVTTRYDEQLIQIQRLSWINKENRHQGVGQLRVVELAANSALFTLDLYGDINNLDGTFYVRGEEIDLSPWLNQLIRTQNQLTQSRGNFEFWAGIKNSEVDSAQIQIGKSEFAWTTPDTTVKAEILDGNLRAVPDGNGWSFNLDDLVLQSDSQSLITSWAGHIGRDGYTQINNLTPLNVQSLVSVLPLAFDFKTVSWLKKLQPRARVNELSLKIGEDFTALANFSSLAWKQVDNLPGLANLTGQLEIFNQNARLTLQGLAGQIKIDQTLAEDKLYQQFSVDAYFDWRSRGLNLYIPQISLVSADLNAQLALSYRSVDNLLALQGEIGAMQLDKVKALFPGRYMGTETSKYLTKALTAGTLNRANLLWFGNPANFPFEQNSGVFQANVMLQDAQLKFDPGWPALTDLDVNLLFENDALRMTSEAGKLKGVELNQLSAVIPELASDAVLTIEARGSATGQTATELILASNLADSVGVALTEGVNISGSLFTDLNLTIPLSNNQVVAQGDVHLNGNSVLIPSVGLEFDDANGRVTFRNDVVTIDILKASLLDQAVEIGLQGKNDSSGAYLAEVSLSGNWQVEPLLNKLNPGMKNYLQGKAGWTSTTNLVLRKDSYDYQFSLQSDLLGLESNLPTPFDKGPSIKRVLLATSSGDNQASVVNVNIGSNLRFQAVLPHDTMRFSRAHLTAGEVESNTMGLGFSIAADLEYADFDAWYEAISVLLDDLPDNDDPVLAQPERVYVNADTMMVAGQKVENLQLVAKHTSDDWLLDFNAEQIRAKVTFHGDWLEKGIDISADFINLTDWQGEATKGYQSPILNNLPPVSFECKDCKIFGKDLGRVDFSLSRAATGMKIDSLRLNNANGILYASGDWFLDDDSSSTQLAGELSSPDFGALLYGFGLDSGIKDSRAKFDFDLSWQDAPHKFSFDSLNGGIQWRLTDGRLSDVSDQGARLFSILSLQSLVRKLSLDFRDVFAKGFFYDKMDGSFQITNGKADTQDTTIDGSAGEMTLRGYTDLVSQELNYQIEFSPNVTSSLPLLVYWMVNPATAIAALALDQMLSEAKVISNIRYSVTGTLEDPVMTELDRKSKDIAIPKQAIPELNENSSTAPLEATNQEKADSEETDG